jgi:predicted O-methyltransferase YrrM
MTIKNLISQDQLNNAKLYSTKFEFIKHIPKGGHILEIGTLGGDYAEPLLAAEPASLDLLDTFESKDWEGSKRFTSQTHYDYINDKFKNNPEVSLLRGYTDDILPTLTKKYDYIYIDADHNYAQVKKDLMNSVPLIADGGIIGFNDYIYDDRYYNVYGVIQTVCEFLNENKDWQVIAFALQEEMYADIYIQKC